MKKIFTLLLFIAVLLSMCLTSLPTAQAEDAVNIDIGSVSAGGTGYTFASNTVTINTSGSYTITGTSTSNKIKVASSVTADITLSSANIDISSSYGCAFNMTGAAVNLTLVGDNVLKSAANYAGLHISQGALTITEISTGTLTATGGNYGAGIGSGSEGTTGSITIKGGTVIATGTQGAGIGGGNSSGSTDIIITGGNVTANGGSDGAGIGGCDTNACGNICITGGTIHANGGWSAAGIGCGNNGSGGSITINGGDVYATGGLGGMGIGTQYGIVDVNIGGGTIEAKGGDYASGIGGGSLLFGEIGSVHITGGNITATGGKYAAGIGGIYGGYICNITIDNGTINATGSDYGAGIGGGSDCGKKGAIVINGGSITAIGGFAGAGIGAGGGKDDGWAQCGDITITGGEITAEGGMYSAGIGGGGGEYGTECGTVTITGADTVVNAKGDPYMDDAYDIGAGHKFTYMTTIYSGALKIDGSATVNYNTRGSNSSKQYVTCIIGGTGAGGEAGLYYCGQKVNGVIDMSAPGTGKLCGTGYTFSGGAVSIGTAGTYAVINATTTNRLMIASSITANVTLRDVNIDVSGTPGACAFDMTGATVNLTLVGDNTLKSGNGCAGLQAPNGSTLTILSAGTGTLDAAGGENGAGVGGGNGSSGGTVTISGGEVTAKGGKNGAGIGGGNGGGGGTVEIAGSDSVMVMAVGGTESDGYDVGSGYANMSGGTLTVNGGATLCLLRNGTNAVTSYITCNIGGQAAGLSLGTYLNSQKKLSVNIFISDHTDGAVAFETVQFAMLVDGVSSTLPEGEIVFKSDGAEIARSSLTHMGGLEENQGAAIISWMARGGTHTLTAEYVQNAAADSYYMTDKGELDNFIVAKIEQVPLTIDDPGTKTYGDAAFALSIHGGIGSGGYSYEVTGEAVSVADDTVTVKKAGQATITVTNVGDNDFLPASASVTVYVNKATPPAVLFPSAGTLTYGQQLSDSALTGGSGDGTYKWESPDTIPTVINTGYNVVFTPNDTDNYDYTGFVLKKNVSINVNKAAPVVTFPTAGEITYGQPLSDSVLNGGSGDGSFAWENPATIPTVLNSGYRVVFTPDDTDNYLVISQIIAVSVQKAEQSIITVSGIPSTVTYGDSSFDLTGGGGSGTGGFSYSLKSGDAVSVSTGGTVTVLKAGTAGITANKAGDSNYLPVSVDVEVTVNKAVPIAVFPTAGTVTYEQPLSDSVLTGGSGDGSFAWESPGTIPTVINNGYNVIFTPNDIGNYLTIEKTVPLIVNKATQTPLTISGIPDKITYGDAPFKLKVSGGKAEVVLSYTVVSGGAATVDTSGKVTVVHGGAAAITVTNPGDDNYLPVSKSVVITVDKAAQPSALSLVVPDTVAYGDVPFRINAGGGSGSGVFSYQVASGDAVTVDSTGLVTVVRPGSATITAAKAGDVDYLSKEASIQINVRKGDQAPLVISVPNKITYGDSPFSLNVSGGSGSGALSYSVISGRSVRVDSDGNITIIRPGEAVLSVKKEANDYYNEITITVEINVRKQATTESAEPSAFVSPAAPSPTATSSPTAAPSPTVTPGPTAAPRPDVSSSPASSTSANLLKPLSMLADESTGMIEATISIDDLPEGTASIKLPSGEIVKIDAAQKTLQLQVSQADINENGELAFFALNSENIPMGNYTIDMAHEVIPDDTPTSALFTIAWIAAGIMVLGIAITAAVIWTVRKNRRR